MGSSRYIALWPLVGLLTIVLVLSACQESHTGESPPSVDSTDTRTFTLAELLDQNEELNTLQRAIERADLNETLQLEGPFMFFAPTNSAFEQYLPGIDTLLETTHQDSLRSILNRHLVRGLAQLPSDEDSLEVSNLFHEAITLWRSEDGTLHINDHPTERSIKAQNGRLYVMHSVLTESPTIVVGDDEEEDAELDLPVDEQMQQMQEPDPDAAPPDN